jgi:hypothetical protein
MSYFVYKYHYIIFRSIEGLKYEQDNTILPNKHVGMIQYESDLTCLTNQIR